VNVNESGVGGFGVAGNHRDRTYQNGQGNVLDGSANAWRRMVSPSLCPRKGEIGPTRGLPDDPTCEIDSNGDDGSRSGGTWRSCASDRCWTTPYA